MLMYASVVISIKRNVGLKMAFWLVILNLYTIALFLLLNQSLYI
jgi:hypothetical protein